VFENNPGGYLQFGVISSTAYDCGTKTIYPSAVTSVGFFRNWIDQQILI
jgi:hypothetical protein